MGKVPAPEGGFCYEPRIRSNGLIDVPGSLRELEPLVDANLRSALMMRLMPRRRRQLVQVQLAWARDAWTALNAAGGPYLD